MTIALALGCGPGGEAGDSGTTGGTASDDGGPTSVSATSPTSTATSPTDPTTPTSLDDTGGCAVGTELCPCTNGGACDPGLVCIDGTCVSDDCSIGAANCPCTGGGACDPGLVCEDGICLDEGGTSATTAGTSDSTDTGEPVDLDDWAKRRPILIDNPNAVALTDHQVMIDLDWDADMSADLADLRFTDEAGTELLPHWIEDFVAPVSLRVWVRVPQVDAMDVGTIYMWYGNDAAADAADPEATFEFWDDFDGNALDAATWTATEDATVANGHLSIPTGSVYSNDALVTQPDYVVEARMRWPNNGESNVATSGLAIGESQGDVGFGARQAVLGSPFSIAGFANDEGMTLLNASFNGVAEPGPSFGYVGISHGEGIVRLSVHHIHSFPFFQELDGLFAGDYYFGLGHLGGSVGGGFEIFDLDVDHVLVRRFHLDAVETFAGAEEDV